MEGRHKFIFSVSAGKYTAKNALDRLVKGDKSRVTTLLRPCLAEKGLTGCHHTPAL